jgi:hypothetical protein
LTAASFLDDANGARIGGGKPTLRTQEVADSTRESDAPWPHFGDLVQTGEKCRKLVTAWTAQEIVELVNDDSVESSEQCRHRIGSADEASL